MIHPALVSRLAAWGRGRGESVGAAARGLEAFEALGPGDVALLGLCNEQGVVANGGRPGAAEGPLAFRAAFGKLPLRALSGFRLFDAGDVPATADYGSFFEVAEAFVAGCAARGALPLVVGGGHDCSYGCWRGLRALGPTAVVAVDAHLDVRPEHGPNSGNPFFRMVEGGLPGADLAQLGLVACINDAAHEAWLRGKGARLHFLEPFGEARALEEAASALAAFRGKRVLATFDLDAFSAAAVPGVSALNPWGLSADAGMALARRFGAEASVACLDFMELAPPLDPDGRSARFAAFLAAAFLEARAAS